VGGALSLLLGVVTLPISAVARERAKGVGLVSQSFSGWLGDFVKSQAIGVGVAGAGGALLVVGLRRFPRRWWIPGAGVVVVFGVLTTYAGPVLLDPLFNQFKVLPAGKVRQEVFALAKKAGVNVGQVYEINASSKTSAANAYVTGIGSTKRVVLYDTLLKDFTPKEVNVVVAHELSHVKNEDVPYGLLYFALVTPFAMFAISVLGRKFVPSSARSEAAMIPAIALASALIVPVIGVISNQLSRAMERRADYFAMTLTNDPKALIGFERRIAVQNVIDPSPSGLVTFLLATHPTTVQRIGAAKAFERLHHSP
jgi:STE24 endopeptidase